MCQKCGLGTDHRRIYRYYVKLLYAQNYKYVIGASI
jgi:hypothetical protein